jgi:two-component system sensor histidine kinase AlgZ
MKTAAGREHAFYLPDFCTSRATLAVVLIVELTALVLTLARQSVVVDFWTDLVRTSLFLLWIGLTGAAALSLLRARLSRLSVGAGSAAVLASISAVVAGISLCVYLIGRTQMVTQSGGLGLFPADPLRFGVRNVWIGLIVTADLPALLLRLAPVAAQRRAARDRARVHALRVARIRPHSSSTA